MKTLFAEIISIGNELLAGYTINTNAAYISRKLMTIGLPVNWVTTIRDEHDAIISALQTAAARADVILLTGGLGPTPDDITKKAIAEFFNVEMVWNEQVLQDVIQFLSRRGAQISDANRRQAYIPAGDAIIFNPVGTAPGLVFHRENRRFFFMPGVPGEMEYMIDHFILNDLKTNLNLPTVHNRLLRTTGIPESRLFESISDLIDAHPQYPVAFLPRYIGVDLRFRFISKPDETIELFEQFVSAIRTRLGKFVFSAEEIELEEQLGKILNEKKLTLATAESFTGGMLGDWITNIPGSSDYYLGGVVTYSNVSKIDLLGVRRETLEQFGAVSAETVREMVRGVQKKFNSDCAIATTGIAGPTGATATKPVGLCFIAARFHEREIVREFHFGTQRLISKKRGAVAGLELLRRLILWIE